MGRLLQDLRIGLRGLIKNPGFSAAAITSLALGIGAITTVYTMVSVLIMNPLPFEDADRILAFKTVRPSRGDSHFSVSYRDFRDWQKQSESFEYMAVYRQESLNLSGPEGPERVSCGRVSAGFFPLLRVSPEIGRYFLAEETRPGGDAVAVLSHALWERRYSAKPDIVDSAITLHGEPFTVIGVAPASFRFLDTGPVDVWIPVTKGGWFSDNRSHHWVKSIGRLKDGVTREQAQTEMQVIAERLAEQHPETNADKRFGLVAAHEGSVGDARGGTLVLFGAVTFVLLIACVNVANLLLARGASRQREVAVRIAVGASRSKLVRQMLTESLLLAVLGGALGLLVAHWGNDLVISKMPSEYAEWIADYFQWELKPDVFLFTAGIAAATAILFGLLPALRASNPDVNAFLKDGGTTGLGTGRHRLLAALVVGQVALAFVLLVAAVQMIQSFQRLQKVDPGFDVGNLLVTTIDLPKASYADDGSRREFYRRLLEQIKVLPGVRASGAATIIPFSDGSNSNAIHVEGYPPLPPGQYYLTQTRVVTPGYFQALGIPLLAGRDFAQSDQNPRAPVAIVSEAFRKKYWPEGNPLGKRLKLGTHTSQDPWMTVVGVVGDSRRRLNQEPRMKIYRPVGEAPIFGMTLVMRTSVAPETIVPSLRDLLASLDPDLPLSKTATMEAMIENSMFGPNLAASMLSAFAAIALGLATVGVYGVISYTVAQRTHEFGVRMALGAQRRRILNVVRLQGFRMAGLGVGIGLVFALLLSRVMESVLNEAQQNDPLTYAAVAVGLVMVVLLASSAPARRATKVDPMVALRYE